MASQLFLTWVLITVSQVGVGAAAPDFQSMKIKELKQFLNERGDLCEDCVEKSQFVARAIAVQDQPKKSKEELLQDILDDVTDLRTNLGLDASSDDLKATIEAAAKTAGKGEGTKEKPKENKKTTAKESAKKTNKKDEAKPKAEKKAESKPKTTSKKTSEKSTKEEKTKKGETTKGKEKAQKTEVKPKKSSAEDPAAKKAEEKGKKTEKKTEEKPKKTTEEKAKKSNDKKEETKVKPKKETKNDTKKDTKKDPKKSKDTKSSDKKDSGTIGAVWRTRGSKACQEMLKEDSKAPADTCNLFGTGVFEVFEEFDKSMGSVSFLGSDGAAKKGGLKTTSLTQPFLANGLKVVKAAATAAIAEAAKRTAVPKKGCGDMMCSMFCEHGFKKDEQGCDLCACSEPPAVPPAQECGDMMCSMFCEHGFKKDERGCDICSCSEAPAEPPIVAQPLVCPELTCALECDRGLRQDAQGCEICACKEACAEMMCTMFCENGFKQDQDGCDMCECKGLGGQQDSHGCATGGGYTWCEAKAKCLRTWEEPCETMGGQQDEHGCATGGGYTWCEAKKKCLRTWEEPCEGGLGGQQDSHGCATGGGYTWCEAKAKCLRTWEEPCEGEAAVQPPKDIPQAETAPSEEKTLLERIKEIIRKETMTWLFEVAMKDPEKLRRQQRFDDILKNKFGDGWEKTTSGRSSGKASEAEQYFDSIFDDKEPSAEEAAKAAKPKIPATLLRKGYNPRDSRSHALEPEESDGVVDLDQPMHDEI